MIPKEAIVKAIEGGYGAVRFNGAEIKFYHKAAGHMEQPYLAFVYHYIALDPSFWQSLGKALDWYLPVFVMGRFSPNNSMWPNWLEKAQEFHTTVLTGGDTTKYWIELLPPLPEKNK